MSGINSIANGSFLLGQTSATNFMAGPGISITQPSEGTVRIGNDETVLWSANLGAQGVTTATLSEPFTNFEQLEVWWAQQTERTLVERYYTANLTQLFCTHGKYQASDDYIYFFVAAWGISGTSANKLYCKYKSQDQWNTNTWNDANELCPCKIIGINRLSGSNA